MVSNVESHPKKELIKRRAKQLDLQRNLYKLCHYLGYKDVQWKTHKEIIQSLESDSKRKLIVVPRNCFKSTIGVVSYSIWRLLKNPNERIFIDSEVYENSKNFLREIKAHLESPALTSLFGTFKTKTWNESEIIIKQRTVHKKEASITVGGIGTVKVGQHYSCIIGDDYNSPNNSNTKEKCQKIIDHYKYNVNILDTNGTYVIIGTRYSENDLIGWILRDQLDEKELSEGILL
jgi:hypothetical protein